MTEQEYLDLKEWLTKNNNYIDELYTKLNLPQSDKLIIPSFDPKDQTPPRTEEEEKLYHEQREIWKQISIAELNSEFAVDLIWAYEVGIKNKYA